MLDFFPFYAYNELSEIGFFDRPRHRAGSRTTLVRHSSCCSLFQRSLRRTGFFAANYELLFIFATQLAIRKHL